MLSSNNIVLLNGRTMRLLAFNQFIFIIQSGMHAYPAVVVFIFLTLNNALCSICVSAVCRTWYFYQLDFFFESKSFTIPTDLFIINLVLAMNLPCKLHMDAKLGDFGTEKKLHRFYSLLLWKYIWTHIVEFNGILFLEIYFWCWKIKWNFQHKCLLEFVTERVSIEVNWCEMKCTCDKRLIFSENCLIKSWILAIILSTETWFWF